MIHVAVLKDPYIDLILDGVKTIESRLLRNRSAPFDRVVEGQRIFFKASGGGFRAHARIAGVEQHESLSPTAIDRLRRRHNKQICAPIAFWRERRGARYAVLISVENVVEIDRGPRIPAPVRAGMGLPAQLAGAPLATLGGMNPLVDLNSLTLDELYHELARTGLIERLLQLARDEDLGGDGCSGDITSICWGDSDERLTTRLVLREPATIAGVATLPDLLSVFAPDAEVSLSTQDGDMLETGATLAMLAGPASQLLQMERPMLNLISRLSGIATLTRRYADLASPSKVLDTRKTTPGLRVLEKYAVRCGGGHTHRMGLHDAVLLKDNHLASCARRVSWHHGSERQGPARAERSPRFVEVEVDSLDQLEQLLTLEPRVIDIVLLDNMTPDVLRQAVTMRDGSISKPLLEASGGVSLKTIGRFAASGVDRISVGALTHSAASVDIGLDAL